MLNQTLLVHIPKERVPVILYGEGSQAQGLAATAVNLLRIGYPAVQVIVDEPNKFGDPRQMCESMRKRLLHALESLSVFIDSQTPGIKANEVFGIKTSHAIEGITSPREINCVFLVYRV
jgi:hypothetical protein